MRVETILRLFSNRSGGGMSVPVRQGEAVPPQRFGPVFPATAVAAYAAASADDNPLHTDPELAAKAGLARPPIHGMLIMGCFESYLAQWRPDADDPQAVGQVHPSRCCSTKASRSPARSCRTSLGEPAVLRLTVKRHAASSAAGDLVCLGEAFVDA